MELLVVFKTKKLPRHHQFLFASIVKSALSNSNPEMQKKMYRYSENQANKMMRPFTGAIYLNKYILENGEFSIQGDVRLTMSSPDAEFMLYLYNGFVQQQCFKYQSYELTLEKIQILPQKLPKSNRVLMKTNSPLIVKNSLGKYLEIDDSTYVTELNYAANECMKSIMGRSLYEPIAFTPIAMHKKVVQLKHDKFAKLNDKGILYMNAHEGNFILEGHPEDLSILTQAGLGFRRALFFGHIEMINE